MLGAVAAGREGGGYDTLADAAARMGGLKEETFEPRASERAAYDELFVLWKRLHDTFGREGSDLMKRLRRLRAREESNG